MDPLHLVTEINSSPPRSTVQQNFQAIVMADQNMKRDRPLLEIACFSKESAVIAANAGADRIELCHDYASGGLSPASETVAELKAEVSVPIYVMIRPHAETFCYSHEDYETMRHTVEIMKQHGADGFVFGILNSVTGKSGSGIDVPRNKALVELAAGRPCTFHRAFDLIQEVDWPEALRDIRRCGFTSILTSGGPSEDKAIDCVDQLKRLVKGNVGDLSWSSEGLEDSTPDIIVGGGVRSNNVELLWEEIRPPVFHSAALGQGGEVVDEREVRALRAVLDKSEGGAVVTF